MRERSFLSSFPVFLFCFLLFVGLSSVGVYPAERTFITLYQNGPSLVVIHEEVELERGVNRLSRPLPSSADAETVFITSSRGKVDRSSVVPALGSEGRLLEELVGTKLTVIGSGNPEYSVEGTLVGTLGGSPVLKTSEGEIKLIKNPGGYQFEGLSPSRFKSRLEMSLVAEGQEETELTVGYHLSGLSWNPAYVGFLDEEGESLDLRGIANIRNETDTSFRTARLQLLAGSPSREERGNQLFATREAAAPRGAPPEEVFEYYRYAPESPLDLLKKVKTRKEFLHRDSVEFEKYYRFVPSSAAAVRTVLELRNSEESGLGVPMAAGTIRIYEETPERTFLGADSLPNLPEGDSVELELGDAFDVKGRRKRTEHEKLDENAWRDKIVIELDNRKEEAVPLRVIERLPGSWEIERSSREYEKLDASRIRYRVKVPGGGSTSISYVVKYQH